MHVLLLACTFEIVYEMNYSSAFTFVGKFVREKIPYSMSATELLHMYTFYRAAFSAAAASTSGPWYNTLPSGVHQYTNNVSDLASKYTVLVVTAWDGVLHVVTVGIQLSHETGIGLG